MKRISALFFTSAFLSSLAFPAVAAEFMAHDDLSVTVPVAGDLYAFGSRTRIEENVDGDLITAGGELLISGDIAEDLIAAGGQMTIKGNVGDDLRIAGGNITIEGNVKGDAIIAGGTVNIYKSAVIEGDLIITGGEVVISGDVRGNINIRSARVTLEGAVLKNAKIQTEELLMRGSIAGETTLAAERSTIAAGSVFTGPVQYWSPEENIDFGDSTKQGASFNADLGPTRINVSPEAQAGIVAVILSFVIGYSLLSASLAILVLLLSTKTYFPDAAKRLRSKPWQSLLIGFLYFVGAPLLGIFLFVTFIGIPLGVFVFAVYGVSVLFASVMTAMVFAKWAEIHWKKKWKGPMFFLVSLCVFVLIKVIGFVPVIGWITKAVLIFMAFGALAHTEYVKYKKVR